MTNLARLKWQCRRGMKELDVLLQRYLTNHYPHADTAELAALQTLLDLQDDVLYAYIMGQQQPDDVQQQQVLTKLRGF